VCLICGSTLIPAAATASTSAPATPNLQDLSRSQRHVFLARVALAPAPLRRLIEAAYPVLRVVPSHRELAGGSNYTVTVIDARGTRFVVALSPEVLAAGPGGLHATMHELGHVIINRFFGPRDYSGAFTLFMSSPAWEDCFPAAPTSLETCVSPDEILAEQIAFLVSSRSFRSSYGIPPLAIRTDMLDRLRLAG
jgi:hypothetical protein